MFLNLDSYSIMAIVWAVFIVVSAIIELQTVDLVSIWFTVGAIGALIAALFKLSIWIQLALFVGIAIIAIICTRPIAKRMQQKEIIHTNADRIIGEFAIVTKQITPNEIGEVKIEGRIWRAYCDNNMIFDVDEKVVIEAISGSKVLVAKLEKNKEKEIL